MHLTSNKNSYFCISSKQEPNFCLLRLICLKNIVISQQDNSVKILDPPNCGEFSCYPERADEKFEQKFRAYQLSLLSQLENLELQFVS